MSKTSFVEAITRQPGYVPCATTRLTSTTAMERIKETIDAAKKKHGLVGTTSFENIQSHRKNFYDCVCQIVGIFVQRNDPKKRTYLRVTDGTILPGNTPIDKAVDEDLQKSKYDAELEGVLKSVLIDICCWDEFATKAMEYKLGDIVKLGNMQVKVLDYAVSFGLNSVGPNTAASVARFANLKGITFLERGWHPQSASMDENTSIVLRDFDTGGIAQKELQSSEVQKSIVNDSYSEQQSSQEKRNFVQALGQFVVSHVQKLSLDRKRLADAEIREILRKFEN